MNRAPWMENEAVPEITVKRDSWMGWIWGSPTLPPGASQDSYWTSSPFVSGAVFRNRIRSPWRGFSMIGPTMSGVTSLECFAEYRR